MTLSLLLVAAALAGVWLRYALAFNAGIRDVCTRVLGSQKAFYLVTPRWVAVLIYGGVLIAVALLISIAGMVLSFTYFTIDGLLTLLVALASGLVTTRFVPWDPNYYLRLCLQAAELRAKGYGRSSQSAQAVVDYLKRYAKIK